MRFDGAVPAEYWAAHLAMLIWLLLARTAGFVAFGQFPGLWRHAHLDDLRVIVMAVGQIRRPAIEDLLSRQPVGLDPAPVRALL